MAHYPHELEEYYELNRENRRNTLNKRINRKGNYENYITGGSHALNNQAFFDRNEYANGIAWNPNNYQELTELNDRYTNPQHNERAGNAPYGSGLKYIHRYTPSTRRGRRVSDIFFEPGRHGIFKAHSPMELAEYQDIVNKYEGWK